MPSATTRPADSTSRTDVHAVASDLRVLIGQLRRRLREEASRGRLSEPQANALVRLEREGPATVTTLAHAEGVRPQSMGATVAALVAAGLVVGAPDPHDGRQTLLSLTAAARKFFKTLRAARDDWLARTIRAKLSQKEQQQLAIGVDLLQRLVES